MVDVIGKKINFKNRYIMTKKKEENPMKTLAEQIFGGVKDKEELIQFFLNYLNMALKPF